MNRIASTWLMMMVIGGVAPAFGQNLLDEALGPKETPKPAAPATAPAQKEEPKPAPRGPEMVSPGAAKTLDDQDLIRDLTQPGGEQIDPRKVEDRVKAMLARMNDSAQLLKDKKDTGDLTQETQRRIVMDLDVMIELARQQQQQQQQSSSQQQPQPGQQRQPGQPQPGQPQPGQPGGSNPAGNDDTHPGQSAATTGEMRNRDPANWGGLPPRDRDEISHGANEEYLSAYKTMIDRYYQMLAELGKKSNR